MELTQIQKVGVGKMEVGVSLGVAHMHAKPHHWCRSLYVFLGNLRYEIIARNASLTCCIGLELKVTYLFHINISPIA